MLHTHARVRGVVGIALLALALSAVPASAQGADAQVIRVGALLSITGVGSSLGNTSKAALQVGVKRLNKELAKQGVKIELDIVDTGEEATRAQAGFAELADKGVNLIIGPQSSSEVAAIMDAANQQGVLVVSHASTASTLSIPDDNIFRLVPNDHVEARATTDRIIKDGANTIVPLWRSDRGNDALSDSVRAAATSEGLTVTAGFRYAPDTNDFGPALRAISSQVAGARGKVAVLLAGFEEAADALAAAGSVPGLEKAKWYGADGAAEAQALIDNDATVAFATKTGRYPSPLVALPSQSTKKYATLIEQIGRLAKAKPDAFALAAYDALNVGVKALREAGTDADGAALRSAFTRAANGYRGVTGTIDLDAGGDRASAPYAFWSICGGKSATAQWQSTGTWTPGADPTGKGKLKITGCPKG